jgi:hypothetical protein
MLSRVGPAKAQEKEFGHGDKAREGAHRTEALARGFSVDTQKGMTKHEVWYRQGVCQQSRRARLAMDFSTG